MKPNVIAKQHGAALLLIVVALIMSAAWLSYELMGGLGQKLKRQNAQEVAQALAEAKENLMTYALNTPEIYGTSTNSPGFLPCPDTRKLTDTNSGSPNATCSWGASTSFGRLPSQKANPEYYFFSLNEKESNMSLWYAVSDPLRNITTSKNPVYEYDFTKTSVTLDNDPTLLAAIVIAAGEPVAGQTGRDATQTAAQQWNQYLESMTTANMTTAKFSTLTTLPTGTPYNDKIISITLADFQAAVKSNVCARAKLDNLCDSSKFPPNTGANVIPITNWFRKLKWSDSNGDGTGISRICLVTAGKINGINPAECP
jgi:predicted NAD-dependent protein-ADP-ribosyltransferase YbiA (DUF1768 family)